MKKTVLLLVLGFLSAGVCAQNSTAISGVPQAAGAAVQPELKQEKGIITVPAVPEVVLKPAVPSNIAELKMKQGQAMAALKKKQQKELKSLKEQMRGSSRQEIQKALEAKKGEYKEAVKSLRDDQKKEMEQFKKAHP